MWPCAFVCILSARRGPYHWEASFLTYTHETQHAWSGIVFKKATCCRFTDQWTILHCLERQQVVPAAAAEVAAKQKICGASRVLQPNILFPAVHLLRGLCARAQIAGYGWLKHEPHFFMRLIPGESKHRTATTTTMTKYMLIVVS